MRNQRTKLSVPVNELDRPHAAVATYTDESTSTTLTTTTTSTATTTTSDPVVTRVPTTKATPPLPKTTAKRTR